MCVRIFIHSDIAAGLHTHVSNQLTPHWCKEINLSWLAAQELHYSTWNVWGQTDELALPNVNYISPHSNHCISGKGRNADIGRTAAYLRS